jgi:hypothetical protein
MGQMPKTAKTKIVLRFANFIFIGAFTDAVKMRVNMKLIVDFLPFHCYN